MDVNRLRELLKQHGLDVEQDEDGFRVVGKPLEALADQREKVYLIKCRHEVDITYSVRGTSFADALAQLCGRELFCELHEGAFGPDRDVLFSRDIDVVDSDVFTDPSPTGRGYFRRDWMYEIEGEDDE
ncbi:hypothetical protein CMI37_16460 [Candidatus Pacearchaeota archaeon]|nr:hypothetical protein [Candidatus Pacearchaeota archaeon]|tara:strand:+ start:1907 stop:2290 length:384 start_codon:yes stop_codon:yes gene_type:complete